MRYLKEFSQHSNYEQFIGSETAELPNVSICDEESHVHYNPIPDYSKKYFTIVSLDDSDEYVNYSFNLNSQQSELISYSTDDGFAWVSIFDGESGRIKIPSSRKVLFRSNVFLDLDLATSSCGGSYGLYRRFTLNCNGNYAVEGNIMSLLYGDDFINRTTFNSESSLKFFFGEESNLISAENLVLPATTLTDRCYSYMFAGCTNLTTAPVLPAATLADYCYDSMLEDCTSLTTAPALPATTLADSCYSYMFAGCANLTTAPELSATTLAYGCYRNMFSGCTSLTTAPELPATTLTARCYENMFGDCTGLTTAPALLATELASECYSNMFSGCTSLTTAPELSATALTDSCYYGMFWGCTSLTTTPSLPATTLVSSCYRFMFAGCTSLTTAPELLAATLVDNCYGFMFWNCTNLNYIKMLATDISASWCLSSWVEGVASTGTFVKNAAAQWNVTGVDGIPTGWTVQTASA